MNKTYLLLVVSAFAPGILLACSGSDDVPDDGGDGPREAACEKDADCDDDLFCTGTETCDAGVCVTTDNCSQEQDCDEERALCETDCEVDPDADGDGHEAVECGGDDCDDSDANRYPGNVEVCDSENVDEDCDPSTFGALDEDEDGFVSSACCNEDGGELICGLDCNDKDRGTNPNVPEVCDGHDTDCNGIVDDGGDLFWEDSDKDMYGNPEVEVRACEPPSGYVQNKDDCDDQDDSLHPGADESTCNAIDNDCDGEVDEDLTTGMLYTLYVDADGDGHGDATAPAKQFCQPTAPGYVDNADDCFDDQPNVHPGAVDICDGLVNACKTSDTVLELDPSEDVDGDGYSPADADCIDGFPKTDCNDNEASINPGILELCDGSNNNCNAVSNDGCPSAVFLDSENTMTLVLATSTESTLTATCPEGQAAYLFEYRSVHNMTINGLAGAALGCRTPNLGAITTSGDLRFNITATNSALSNRIVTSGAGAVTGVDDIRTNKDFLTSLVVHSLHEPYDEGVQITGHVLDAYPREETARQRDPDTFEQMFQDEELFVGQPSLTCPDGWVITAVTFADLTEGQGEVPEGGLQLLSMDCTRLAVELIPAE